MYSNLCCALALLFCIHRLFFPPQVRKVFLPYSIKLMQHPSYVSIYNSFSTVGWHDPLPSRVEQLHRDLRIWPERGNHGLGEIGFTWHCVWSTVQYLRDLIPFAHQSIPFSPRISAVKVRPPDIAYRVPTWRGITIHICTSRGWLDRFFCHSCRFILSSEALPLFKQQELPLW